MNLKSQTRGISSENHGVRERISLDKLELLDGATITIKYVGCVTIDLRKENLARPIDFLIPPRENGSVEIKRISSHGRSYNNRIFIPYKPGKEEGTNGELLIRIRNILFVDASIFVTHNGRVFRLEQSQGPFYMYLDNGDFFSLWKQLMNKEN